MLPSHQVLVSKEVYSSCLSLVVSVDHNQNEKKKFFLTQQESRKKIDLIRIQYQNLDQSGQWNDNTRRNKTFTSPKHLVATSAKTNQKKKRI